MQSAGAAGRLALYVCFNRPLADAMKRVAPDPSQVVTFHELARLSMEQAGQRVDFSRGDAFQTLARGFNAISARLAGTFDTLVIDEGQDFEQEWATSVIGLAKPDARVLWLEDPEQTLYERPRVELPGWARLLSPVNYRTPQLLVEFMNWLALTDTPVESGSAIRGFDPIWIDVPDEDGEAMITSTADAVRRLVDQGFATRNIVVLSYRGQASSALVGKAGRDRLAGHRVKRQLGYDERGDALWSEGELLVDTIFRFKGQAADAVVLTEVDFDRMDLRERRRLFVGISRARLHLALVSTRRAAAVLRERLDP
jgi:superfamily I DNA and RNA helicase